MSESHEATIQWSGSVSLANQILEAAQRPYCETLSEEHEDGMHVSVIVQHADLQSLRDIVDALLINFAEIEEQN